MEALSSKEFNELSFLISSKRFLRESSENLSFNSQSMELYVFGNDLFESESIESKFI